MSKSFYQLLYQNETLYRVSGEETVSAQVEAPVSVADVVQEPPISMAPPVPPPVSVPPALAAAPLPSLNHQILILVDETPAMSASNTIFLEKVLKAVNLNLDGVDILNVAGSKQMDFRPLLQHKKVHHFISFGVPFININLEIMMNRYDPKRIAGVNFLLAESLDIVQADDKNKRALWGALKKIFLG
ncbi:hypothetical protein [Runella slithyformis]|uniref:Uncharacterized protein n=1 Tax=Runella slithyformis (strain ATCC 29530 / DSM 19594 / LMG 11500 / NCIMB 11436 / LSU 4) TaxID=761193 RepID=A0A7U4E8Y7_RUNSL|nr:hypothetical protein [Runella slithyformis]AEI51809.1 hypothetical protein Runsl_5519 [Runella slithyformis DSM 19594]